MKTDSGIDVVQRNDESARRDNARPHILHIFPTFAQGGAQIRLTQLLGHLGDRMRTYILALDGDTHAATRLPASQATLLPAPMRAKGFRQALEIKRLLKKMRPDLAVTYNWGAMDAVLGVRMAAVCPLIHAEDGFGPDESVSLKRRRIIVRRILLHGAYKTILPSRTLHSIAIHEYRLPPSRVEYIPNGVDTERFRPRYLPEFWSSRGWPEDALVFGFVGQLRKEKNLELLLRAFQAASQSHWRLALVGDGPCLPELQRLASDLGIADRIAFTGAVDDPAPYFQAFNVFVMSSATEQMPLALLEAMACGLPAVVTDPGDVRDILSAQSPEVVACGDVAEYGRALEAMAGSRDLRLEIGRKNRARCVAQYSERTMVEHYERLYRDAIALRGQMN